MKKMLLFLMAVPLLAFAERTQPEVTVSDKSGGQFISSIKVAVNTPYEQAYTVLDKFVAQYKDNLDSLFDWALLGLKLKGEKDDMISVDLQSHVFDAERQLVNGMMHLYVSILRKDFPETMFETTIAERKETNLTTIDYEMLRCDNVIEHVNAQLAIAPAGNDAAELTFDVAFKAKNPYNFMSKKQYRDNIEWRLVKFLSNLRDEAEKQL